MPYDYVYTANTASVTNVYPLNSRRLTIACLRRGLGIPCSGSGDELRQLHCIVGKLLVDRSTTDIVVTVKETPSKFCWQIRQETTPSYRSTELGENEVQLRELCDTLSPVREELHVACRYKENLQLNLECARWRNRTLELQQIKLEEDMKESRTQLAKEKERLSMRGVRDRGA